MYTYNIFAYLYFKSTKFHLLATVYARSLSYGYVLKFFFSSLLFLFFLFSKFLVSTRRTRESTRFTRQFRSFGLISSRILLLFIFSRFYIHYFLTYPYQYDSLWSIIVTASRMTSRRRSAPSSLSPPQISRWLITRTIIKICTLFHPLALSLTLFRFPSLFFSIFCVSRILNCFKGTYIVNYKYR